LEVGRSDPKVELTRTSLLPHKKKKSTQKKASLRIGSEKLKKERGKDHHAWREKDYFKFFLCRKDFST